jgi:glycosyltransferase involved in cell wall biosynthesis
MNKNVEVLESALSRLESNESCVYFLVYDTKNNPRASVKHIYDMALTLKKSGFNAKILAEDKTYGGVSSWLGDKYSELPVHHIKDDKIEIKIDDMIVVPEYYSNVLEQLSNIKCVKIMLVQQKDFIFETLPIGSRWSDYGFDKVITTTEGSKKYILEYFPESLVFIVPPIIGEQFTPSDKPLKPYIAISCRDRALHRKLISQFYLKYPQLRWITFKDMVQQTYDEFADSLKECMVSLWVDDESTFGTFPLESMKCGVPVVGKIPNTEPDWISENGMWTYDVNKLLDILGTYILAWLEGVELKEEVKSKMKDTLLPYETSVTENNIVSIFTSLKNKRVDLVKTSLEKLKNGELKQEEKV